MTYLCETIPARQGEEPEQYEIKQSASEPPLTRHPETGVPIRRVILGGWGVFTGKAAFGASSVGCGCGPSGCC
ncbi:MAG: zinc ribbon domain-containing protein [Limisphaerales bacterium]